MKRKTINNAMARRRSLVKTRHKRILNRHKLFFSFLQQAD
ncbi:MAG: hypothetical protein Sw1PiTSA_08430 [Shewanella algae]|jgi:hypothetical protein|uniref:Uncharacterized protein n=2 Tax=Shewanella TaxID=22 RepID=A0A380C957_9GAMM|nr:hypothetical protein [Shewanella sp.]PYE60001.1 hypothetical protein C8J23_10578 [Shewanella chilikensis]SUJ14210.1 Uncharacterised protein [Shewanella algae]GHB08572.1 hypothetical protein GCM10007107_22020 [Shewanella indica]BCV28872.1 hypothetical protein TUM3811_27320 [Shewanella algae]